MICAWYLFFYNRYNDFREGAKRLLCGTSDNKRGNKYMKESSSATTTSTVSAD